MTFRFDKIRYYLGSAAAIFWTSGDGLTMARQFIEGQVEALPRHASHLDTLGGAILLFGNAFLLIAGNRYEAVIVRQLLATFAVGLLIISSGFNSEAWLSTLSLLGLSIGCFASAWQAYRHLRQERAGVMPVQEILQSSNKHIFVRFPQLIPMLPILFLNLTYLVGGMIKSSPLEIFVGFLWAIGTICFALSKQTTQK